LKEISLFLGAKTMYLFLQPPTERVELSMNVETILSQGCLVVAVAAAAVHVYLLATRIN
jgi:hypothetical protein